jgi:hypothetical protein
MKSSSISEVVLAGVVSGTLLALLLTVGWFHYDYCYARTDAVEIPITLATTAATPIDLKSDNQAVNASRL